MTENTSLGAYAIMYVVKNRKSQVIQLLLKNGIVVPSNASDMQIALLVTNLLKVSKSFYEDFSVLFLNQQMVNEMNSNMSGSYLNIEGDFCKNLNNKTESPTLYNALCKGSSSTTTPASTTTQPNSLKDTSWLNTGLNLLQTGFAGFLQLDDNKTKRDLADASVKISEDEVEKEKVTPPKAGLSTGAIVGISLLGVTVVGLVIYLIAKKK
jgi:hypothetical protein